MPRVLTTLLITIFLAVPVFAGALTLQIDDPKTNPEAVARHAFVAAHMTACTAPEKTVVVATAEGIIKGQRQSVPLKVIHLSAPGTFAVSQEWPREGTWIVKMIATNPNYDYAPSLVVPVGKDGADRAEAKVFYRAPSVDDVNSVLEKATLKQ